MTGGQEGEMSNNLPKAVGIIDDDLVRRIAKDVGQDVVDYLEWMYPEMVAAARSWKSARVSIRNHTYNQIMAAVEAADKGQTEKSLKMHDRHRRVMRKLRRAKSIEDIIAAGAEP
jgi:light-regulated signal transduction histidine kinase (bacteriophytochrome)